MTRKLFSHFTSCFFLKNPSPHPAFPTKITKLPLVFPIFGFFGFPKEIRLDIFEKKKFNYQRLLKLFFRAGAIFRHKRHQIRYFKLENRSRGLPDRIYFILLFINILIHFVEIDLRQQIVFRYKCKVFGFSNNFSKSEASHERISTSKDFRLTFNEKLTILLR